MVATAEKNAGGANVPAPVNSGSTPAPDVLARAAEWIAPGELTPWAENPRKNQRAVRAVADAIRRFGFGSPIVARRENKEIIAGHTRWQAAKLLGLKLVPVRLLDLSAVDAHKMALADNKLGELAEWDDEAVAKLLSEFSFGDAVLAGWSGKELGKMAEEMLGMPADASAQLGAGLTYSVVVECVDEAQQTALLERFEGEGLVCKPLIT